MDALPKLDRDEYRRWIRMEVERVLESVADAVDNAPRGRVIRDSEEKARDALDEFRKRVYEKALQLKIDAAEAAFPPSAQCGDQPPQAQQGAAGEDGLVRQRPAAVAPPPMA
jgi:hypothetical protein